MAMGTNFPWQKYLTENDKVGIERTYDSMAQLDRFVECVFETGSEMLGNITYYVYDPTKHGYPADREYPLLFALHGAHGGMQGRVAIDWAGAAMFASEEYQKAIGGMYIVCPLANEWVSEDGELHMSWMTPKKEADLTIYSEKTLKMLEKEIKEGFRLCQLMGTDTVYAEALFDILYKEKAKACGISKVILFGVSAGGYCAWRLLIDRPEDFDLALPMCGAYIPAESELRKVEAAGTQVLVCHGRHDELVPFDLVIVPNIELFEELKNFDTYFPEWAMNGQKEIIALESTPGRQQGQHCINNCIQQNMIYDDGSLYDERWPEGMTGLIKSIL